MIGVCEKCGKEARVDIYNDFDDTPGNLFCDPCVLGEKDCSPVCEVVRPEGYYHSPIGSFE